MLRRLRARPSVQFFATTSAAGGLLAAIWWALIVVGGIVPALFSLAVGLLAGALHEGTSTTPALLLLGTALTVMLAQAPVLTQVGAVLGDRLALRLHREIMDSTTTPAGIAHMESSDIAGDLAIARDFDQGMSAPALSLSLTLIANGLVLSVVGLAQAALLFGFSWWAPLLVGGAWLSTHWLLRESTVWDRTEGEVQLSQRQAEYSYQIAVQPAAAKEIRLFGLQEFVVGRFRSNRRHLVDLRLQATRVRARPLRWAVLVLVVSNGFVFFALARAAADSQIGLAEIVIYAQAAVGASLIAFGGLDWTLPIMADSVATVLRLRTVMTQAGKLSAPETATATPSAGDIRFRDVSFTYPGTERPVLEHFDLHIPAGSSLAVVGLNGQGKTTLAKLLCRMYDPDSGSIEVGGVDLRDLDVTSWRRQVTAVFQDFIRFELSVRSNVAPDGAPDEVVRQALTDAGAMSFVDTSDAGSAGGDRAALDTVLAAGYDNGRDLSGGQWQRIALARSLCAVRQGADVVIFDEPTAQLDVRAESEIFDRVLSATSACTTLLISHRFSTVRRADRIAVLEEGQVVELGTHESLMALAGRYRTMFDLQASRFEVH